MLKNIPMVAKRCLIYVLIFIFALPLSVLAFGPEKAAASEKKVEKSKVVDVAAPVLLRIEGLPESNTYFQGQKIKWQLVFNENNLDVWVETDNLDPNFPVTWLAQSNVDGLWQIETPVLTASLNAGGHVVTLKARDAAGNISNQKIKIVLKKISSVTVTGYKLMGDTLNLTWKPVIAADSYLIEWSNQENVSNFKRVESTFHSTEITNLKPGTLYTFKISAVKGSVQGQESVVNVKTLGKPLLENIAGQSTVSTPVITPSITPKAAATKQVAPASSNVTPKNEEKTVTPTPTPSSSTPTENAKTTTGGWSKLLIALSILIIAAGAAIGGYYGYEWLMLRGKDKEPPESSSRW